MTYIVMFNRVGRRRDVEPMIFEGVGSADELAALIYKRVRTMVMSREVEVIVSLISLTGRLVVGGMRAAGEFTIQVGDADACASGRSGS